MFVKAIETIQRREGGKILAGLIRHLGNFDLAEEALQDAYLRALERWPHEGLPRNPSAWLITVAQRRAIDLIRRNYRMIDNSAELLNAMAAQEQEYEITEAAATSGVADDQLRLIFTCCHPALAQRAQAALALRTLCQLSTQEIARAFMEPESTTAQRLVRAKKKIADARIPYEIPDRESLPERLAVVLTVIYLVFNEGYLATQHPCLIRIDLCREAIRLGQLVVELMPTEAEASGLLALMLLHHARRDTRVDADGVLIPLEEQNRSQWYQMEIAEGTAELDRALLMCHPGPYQIQAAIAALHANAATADATDWAQISALYGALLRYVPTPIVELNASVALALAHSIDNGLNWLARLRTQGKLSGNYLLYAAQADLLRRAERWNESRVAYQEALIHVQNPAERAYLLRRLRAIENKAFGQDSD